MKKKIYLAGGCFWGMQAYFKRFYGIMDTSVGYSNGISKETSYNKLKETDHAETLEIVYEDNMIRLEEILLHFFNIIDPLSLNKQGEDVGRQYRTGIYYTSNDDLDIINKIYSFVEKKIGEKLVVEVEKIREYILAEDYHQEYLDKNPNGYCHIKIGKIENPLGTNYTKNLDKLNELEYSITQLGHTEKPFSSELNNEFSKGIYVSVVTGEPLFISSDKFSTSCGWPSFSRPIFTTSLNYFEDNKYMMNRIEVKSSLDDAHLGHVFEDGIKEKGGLRYCINGAALLFIPYDKLKDSSYSDYLIFFR